MPLRPTISFCLSSKRLAKSECILVYVLTCDAAGFINLMRDHTNSARHPGKSRELPPQDGQSVCVPSQTPKIFCRYRYPAAPRVMELQCLGLTGKDCCFFILLTYGCGVHAEGGSQDQRDKECSGAMPIHKRPIRTPALMQVVWGNRWPSRGTLPSFMRSSRLWKRSPSPGRYTTAKNPGPCRTILSL